MEGHQSPNLAVESSSLSMGTMKKKKIVKDKFIPTDEKQYWDHYQKLSLSYKAIELNKWK